MTGSNHFHHQYARKPRSMQVPMIVPKRIVAIVLFAALPNLVGCTEYVPVSGTVDAAAKPEIRVVLTDQGKQSVASRLGPRVSRLEGVLDAMTDSSLTLTVRKVSREEGVEDTYAPEQIPLSRADVQSVEKSRTSVSRSVLTAGAIFVSALLVARGSGDVSGSGSGGPAPTGR
jgi:hypothetical protein